MTRVAVAVDGWNAEAAIAFALAARRFASSVALCTGGETADGKDEIEVLTLGPEPGEEIVLTIKGDDEKEAFSTLLARLLSAIERPEQVPAAALASEASGRQRSRAVPTQDVTRRIRDREVVVLDTIEEVAPVRPTRKKDVHRKSEPKTRRKPVTAQRKPRKRKK